MTNPEVPTPSTEAREWSKEFEREAHRLAREDERGKLLTKCQQEVLDELGGDPERYSCPTCKVSAAEILVHAATRAMEAYHAHKNQGLAEKAAREAAQELHNEATGIMGTLFIEKSQNPPVAEFTDKKVFAAFVYDELVRLAKNREAIIASCIERNGQ